MYSDYPESASNNAKKALKHRDENGSDCGTRIGWVRANQLASRESLSLTTVKRTYSFLSRSKTYDQGRFVDDEGNEICGSIMYAAWGGDSMRTWAKEILEKEESKRSMKKSDKTPGVERRTYNSSIEVRMIGEGESEKECISGYALKFNEESQDLGGFVEVIDPKALQETDLSDVRALFNHDPNFVLGRTTNGTLKLDIDDIGLRYEITPSDSQTLKDLVYTPIKRGDVTQSSFGFVIGSGDDVWQEQEQGRWKRTIVNIKQLFDVSPVTFPAYTSTEVTARSFDDAKSALVLHKSELKEKEEREKRMEEKYMALMERVTKG